MTSRQAPSIRIEFLDRIRKRVVLKVFQLSEHPISRYEVSDITGYSIAQTKRIIDILRSERLVRVNGRASSGRTILYSLMEPCT